ncbi:MAG: cytochrome c biogenesis protein CcdA [Deltaproteobacteria bacterium]|nr:cytochrome c biogenesis protein CcdA [Deltaproteobacteria bacterium]
MSPSLFEGANAWLTQSLGSSTGVSSFLLLIVAGILASLLPCVYPLYPITAAFLSRRQSRLGRLAHPLAYYAGLALIYFAFGVVASVTGGSFNEVLRQPLANLLIGGLLLTLALATAGLLHFPALTSSKKSEGNGIGSTLLMGAGAGLLSSACVGPVVVSILVSIAASTTRISAGVALLAAVKMMLFGLGVGLPFLLIGVFGVALPRSGMWMVRVQKVFGALIAWFATGYVFKGLAGFGFSNQASWALAGGALLVVAAVFFAQDAAAVVHERTKRALLALAGVIGFFVIGRTLMAGQASATAIPATAALTETHGNLVWHLDKTAAYAAAAQSGKPVFIDFHGDWCTNCKAFQEKALSDPALNAALAAATLLKVRDNTTLFEQYREDPRFPELKVGLPFFLITDPKEALLYKTSDFTKTYEMTLFLSE